MVIAYIGAKGEVVASARDTSGSEPTAAKPVAAANVLARTSRVLAAPAARRLAEEHGLRLEDISGTGPKGAVTKEDVLATIKELLETPIEDENAPRPVE